MTKKRIHEIYSFLAAASMKRLNDEEKIVLIRLLRQMKPVANEIGEAIQDAAQKAMADGVEDLNGFVMKAIEDLAENETDIDVRIMNQDTFDRLVLSNDWCFGQIDELQTEIVRE